MPCPSNQQSQPLLPDFIKLGVRTALEKDNFHQYFLACDMSMIFAYVNADRDQTLIQAIN